MTTISYTLELRSDAEPGSGLGGEVVNDYVPRDQRDRPVLRATHLKGLLREAIDEVATLRGWDSVRVLDGPFGRPGAGGDDGLAGALLFSDAVLEGEAPAPLFVSRTALNPQTGTARGMSLRTVEAVRRGTRFRGSVRISGEDPSLAELVVRLALLILPAVGGGRTRGAGLCTVTIDAEDRSPGRLLELLGAGLDRPRPVAAPVSHREVALENEELVLARILFRATTPLCCPERPVVGINVIESGLAIPASALQGILLTRASRIDPALGNALFRHPSFRCWPLHPFGPAGADGAPDLVIRVSRTHKMSKLPSARGNWEFRDRLIEPYDWRQVAKGSPLKGPDGLLLRTAERVRFWPSADIPRIVSAHGVHHDPTGRKGRNLFSVVSLAPMAFMGLVALPASAYERLTKSFRESPEVEVGKARSVRGQGTLALERVDPQAVFRGPGGMTELSLLVAQSPIAIPDDADVSDLGAVVARLAAEAGLGEVTACEAHAGLRFGWNRHGHGASVAGSKRLGATRVLTPGTVLALGRPLTDPLPALVAGLGAGRERGFGALLPHPGIASERYLRSVEHERIPSRDDAAKEALALWQAAGRSGPSASQIGRLAALVASGGAAPWLAQQRDRPSRIWHRWERVVERLDELVGQPDRDRTMRVLRTWQDLVIAHPTREARS